METLRSFIAFDIEEDPVVKNFHNAQDLLLSTGASLRIVKPENVHVTLRFLGDISPDRLDGIHDEIKNIDYAPFEVRINGLGVFPNLRHISVVWAGIREGQNELRSIFYQLESNLSRLGFKTDNRGFSPHLTLARVKSGRNKIELAQRIEELKDYDFGIVKAKCLRLKKSVLTPQGPVYSTLREVCH